MGVEQMSAPTNQRATSPPAGNKGRRPTTLSVNNSSTSSKTSPSKSSPTNTTPSKTSTSNTSPNKSTPSKSSPSSRPATSPTSGKTPPKKNGVGGKGSQPPGKPTTTVCHAPVLATEARSKVRPCGCHGAGHHGTAHHHQASTPSPTTKEVPRKKSKPSFPSPKKTSTSTPTTTTTSNPHPEMAATQDKTGNNRYVSTLLWVPKLEPHRFSTTLIVTPDRTSTFNDVIYVKSNGVGERLKLLEARKH